MNKEATLEIAMPVIHFRLANPPGAVNVGLNGGLGSHIVS